MNVLLCSFLVLLLLLGVCAGTLRGKGEGEAAPVQQVHIALAGSDENGNPIGLCISWQTNIDTATTTVRFGMKPGMPI